MRTVLSMALVLAACNETGLNGTDDTSEPSTTKPTTEPSQFGPSLVIEDLHIAGVREEFHAFSLFGTLIDPLLAEQIASGTLLLGIELRDYDLSPDDADMTVGMYTLDDLDGDPSDNFTPGAPETFEVGVGASVDGEPAVHFVDASVTGGELDATGVEDFDLLGDGFPLPLANVALSGPLTTTETDVTAMSDGRLRSSLPMALLAIAPNLLGKSCTGAQSLLDALATGCGLIGIQPDADLDDDGLETLHDDDKDGAIDRCVDGDGTEFLGTTCPSDPAMADGYRLIFVVNAVEAELQLPKGATTPTTP